MGRDLNDQELIHYSLDKALVKNELLWRGAEANLYKGTFFDREVIIKERAPKKYRLPLLDNRIRRTRTRKEARMLSMAIEGGVNVPHVLGCDPLNSILIMEFLHGETLDRFIFRDLHQTMSNFGVQTALLHNSGLIHGDLTVFNAIMDSDNNKLYIIDFGLANLSQEVEKRAVDLYTLQSTLKATHFDLSRQAWEDFLIGYSKVASDASQVIKAAKEIGLRGRYISREMRKPRKQRIEKKTDNQ